MRRANEILKSRYLAIRSTERLAEGRDDLNGLPRRQVRQRAGRDDHRAVQARAAPPAPPWEGIDDLEYATLEWVDWFNHRQLLEPIGYVPPAGFEAAFLERLRGGPSYPVRLKHPSLR